MMEILPSEDLVDGNIDRVEDIRAEMHRLRYQAMEEIDELEEYIKELEKVIAQADCVIRGTRR